MFNITDYCEPKDIYLNMNTPSYPKSDNFIQYFIDTIKDIYSEKETEVIRKDLLEREAICSTVIGNSIAIPHCRSNINFSPALKIFRSLEPYVCSKKAKTESVRLFFFMILPLSANNEHFIILSKIAKLGKNKEWITQLLESSDSQIFYKYLQNIDKDLSQR